MAWRRTRRRAQHRDQVPLVSVIDHEPTSPGGSSLPSLGQPRVRLSAGLGFSTTTGGCGSRVDRLETDEHVRDPLGASKTVGRSLSGASFKQIQSRSLRTCRCLLLHVVELDNVNPRAACS